MKAEGLKWFDDIEIERVVGHTISEEQGEKIRAALHPYRLLLKGHQAGTAAPRTSLALSRGRANGRLIKTRLPLESVDKLLDWAAKEHPRANAATRLAA
jgi:hypothetical protein